MSHRRIARLTSNAAVSSPILPIFAPRIFKPWLFNPRGTSRSIGGDRDISRPIIQEEEKRLQALDATNIPDTHSHNLRNHGPQRRPFRRRRHVVSIFDSEEDTTLQEFPSAGRTLDARFLPFRNSSMPVSPRTVSARLRQDTVKVWRPSFALRMPLFRAVIRQEILLWRWRNRRVDNTKGFGIRPLVSRKIRRLYHKYALRLRIWENEWMRGFASLNSAFNDSVPPCYRHHRLPLKKNFALTRLLRRRPRFKITRDPLFQVLSTPKKTRAFRQALVLHILRRYPERVPGLLPHMHLVGMPTYVVADCFEHLTSYYLQNRRKVSQDVSEQLIDLLNSLHLTYPKIFNDLNPKALSLILYHSNVDGASRLVSTLLATDIHLGPHLRCLIAWKLAKNGYYEFSLKMLRSAIGRLPTTLGPIYAKTTSTILRHSLLSPDGYKANTGILEATQAAGVQLNMYHYVILVDNAISSGDYETALRTFKSITEHFGMLQSQVADGNISSYPRHMSPTGYVYLCCSMINACLQVQDSEFVDEVMRICQTQVAKIGSIARPLVMKILHYTYLVNKEQPDGLYHNLLQIYCTLFDTRPLRELGIMWDAVEDISFPAFIQWTPSTPILGLMMSTYLETVAHPHEIPRLYQDYRSLVEAGHGQIARTAATTMMQHAFLIAMGRHSETLPLCAQVLLDMSQRRSIPLQRNSSFNDMPDTPDESAEIILTAQPTRVTYNILINAYSRFGQDAAVDRVLRLMDKRSILADEYTHNTLIGTWAQRQDIVKAVASLSNMAEKNLEVGNLTMELLLKIRNKDALEQELRKAGLSQ